MKKYRILVLCTTYYPIKGGVERTLHEIYSGLSKRGFDIDLVVPCIKGKSFERETQNFKVYRLGKTFRNKVLRFLFSNYFSYRFLKKHLKKKRYDLINVVYAFPLFMVVKWVKRKLKIPLILSEHHYGSGMDVTSYKENPPFVNKISGRIMKLSDEIIVTGQTQRRFVKKFSGRESKIVSSGTDHKIFNPKKKDNSIRKKLRIKGYMILSVGRLCARKNFQDFIRSAQIVTKKFPDAKFVIIGKGPDIDKLKKLTKNLNLEKNIIFTGFISDENLAKYYATADLFVSSSLYEGFGLIYVEALLCGTPVVTYDTEGCREMIVHNKNGFIVKKKDHKELAKYILKVLSNKKLKKKFENNARSSAMNFTLENNIKGYYKIFKDILKEK